MMNRILFVFLQFFAIGILFAQNNFSYEPISVSQNSEFSIEFVANTEDSMGAFQMDLELDNSNFTFTSEAVEIIDDDYSISYNFIDDNTLRIVAYTTSKQIAAYINESIFKLNIKSLNNPGDYTINVSNLIASDTEANQIEINFQGSLISVLGPKLNLDGQQINFDKIGLNSRYNSSFYIRNDGNESLDINNIEFPDIFEVDESLPLRVSAGERRYINFSLDTSKEIAVNDSITFVTNDSDAQRSSQFIKVQGEVFTSNILKLSNASANNRVPTTINLNLENQEECFGIQLDLVLPSNFKLNSDNIVLTERATGFSISSSYISENTYRVLIFSTTKESISPGNGPISLFEIIPDTNAGVYNLEIQNAMVIGANQQNALTDVYGSTFNVSSPVFRVFNDVIDLKEFNSNTKKDFTINTNNDSNQEIVIDSLNYNNSFISIEGISYPRKIIPYDNLNINASFISSEVGEFNEEIKIYHNGDNSPSIVSVSGTILGQNFLFSDDVIINPNPAVSKNNYLKINIQNDEQVRGIQFDLKVSEDINLDFENLIVLSSLQNFTVSNSALTNGEQRFIIFTTTSTRLPKGNNPLIQIPISTKIKNGSYDVLFKEVFISGRTNTDIATTPSVVGSIEIDYSVPPNASPGELITDEDILGILNLTEISSDVDEDSLTYTVTVPSNGTASVTTYGVVAYKPNADYNGDDSFTYTVSDRTATATGTISVTVRAVNDAPTASAGSIETTEDTAGTLDLSTLSSDIDGVSLTYAVTNPSNGAASVTPDGVVTYTPTANYKGADSFDYTISDGTATATETINVTVTSVNDIPTTSPSEQTAKEDSILSIDFSELISDVDNNALTVVITENPEHGSVTIEDTNFKFNPKANYSGVDSFSYLAVDSDGAKSKVSEVIITIENVNDAPIASDLNTSTDQDTALVIPIAVTDLDTDSTGLQLVATQPSNGQVAVQVFTLTYTPSATFSGVDSFTYYVQDTTDLETLSEIYTVKVTVLEAEQILDANPTVSSLEANGFQDEDQVITLAGTDPNNLDLVYSVSSQPSNGYVVLDGNIITYTPSSGFDGTDSFSYYATNTDELDSNIGQITITVYEKSNQAPKSFENSVSLFAGQTVSVDLKAQDPEGDALTYLIENRSNLISEVTLNSSTGVATIAHYGGLDEESFTFIVNDGKNNSQEATVAIKSMPKPNTRPLAKSKFLITDVILNKTYNKTLSYYLDVSDFEGFSTIVDFTTTDLPNFVERLDHELDTIDSSLKLTHNLAFQANVTYADESSYNYTVKDDQGLNSNSAKVTIKLNPVSNTAPIAYSYTINLPANNNIRLVGYDVDKDDLTFEIVDITNATTINSQDVYLTPENGFQTGVTRISRIDNDSPVIITYRVSDGIETSSPATITID
jgi:hypothetical protein